MMSLLPFFELAYQTGIGETIRNSTWLFPIIEAFHLIGLAVTVGAVLIVDLRLLGVGLNRQPVRELAASVRPLLFGSLLLMFVTGSLMFLSEATKAYYSFAFWTKMISLFLVLVLTFTLRARVTRSELLSERPQLARMTAILSLVLWFGVAWGGRWIGFS